MGDLTFLNLLEYPLITEIRNTTLCIRIIIQMLFFSIVIQPSTEQEREINQIQSEILTSYIYDIHFF